MGVRDRHVVRVIRCAITASELGTFIEHFSRTGHGARVPVIVAINGFKLATGQEHPEHIRHLLCIECT